MSKSLWRQALPLHHDPKLLKFIPRKRWTHRTSQMPSTWHNGKVQDLLLHHELSHPTSARRLHILRAQAMELIYYKRRLGEATEDRLQDQKVSAVVAALTESLAPARTALRVVNLAATARQLKLYRVTRKLASSQLALTSVSALAFKTSRHCSTKASCQGSK